MTIKPLRLRQGDRIGILAPAGPVLEEELKPGLNYLESLGFKTVCAPHCFDRTGYLAGDDKTRVKDLHALFRDRTVRAVLCARGGYGTQRILEKLDYGLFKQNPKILVGYSDITALSLALLKKSGMISIHGPVLRDLLKGGGRNAGLLVKLMTSEGSQSVTFPQGVPICKGRAQGVILGGNLSLICHLIGTPFLPSFRGKLLFIEEKGEPLYRLDRMVTHLLLSGKLQKCAGVMTGTFEDCGSPGSVIELLRERLSRLHMPVMAGLPVGHGEDNVPLPIGVRAVLDTETMRLDIQEPCVRA